MEEPAAPPSMGTIPADAEVNVQLPASDTPLLASPPRLLSTGTPQSPLAETGRHAHEVWKRFNKIRLPKEKAQSTKRNFDAICQACGVTVIGKPQKMRKHLSGCQLANSGLQQDPLANTDYGGASSMEGNTDTDQPAGALTHSPIPGELLPHAHSAAAQASLAQLIRAPSAQPAGIPRQDAGPLGGLVSALSTMQGEASGQPFMKVILDKLIELDSKVAFLSQEVTNLNGHVIRLTNDNKQLRGWLQQAPRTIS